MDTYFDGLLFKMIEILELWSNADAVCFDVDSTVCIDEGIDELAEFCGAGRAVAEWTARLDNIAEIFCRVYDFVDVIFFILVLNLVEQWVVLFLLRTPWLLDYLYLVPPYHNFRVFSSKGPQGMSDPLNYVQHVLLDSISFFFSV